MKGNLKVGLLLLMASYILTLLLAPPYWVPWQSPLNMFGILGVIFFFYMTSMIGGALIAKSVTARTSPSIPRSILISVAGPIGGILPIYLYLVSQGSSPTSRLVLFIFGIAFISGVVNWYVTDSGEADSGEQQ